MYVELKLMIKIVSTHKKQQQVVCSPDCFIRCFLCFVVAYKDKVATGLFGEK